MTPRTLDPGRATPQRVRTLAVAISTVAALDAVGGCTEPEPEPEAATLTADEAWELYGPFATEATEALLTAYPSLDWDTSAPFVGVDSSANACALNLGHIRSSGFIPLSEPEYLPRASEYDDFDSAREALDPVLERHGFPPLGAAESNKAKMVTIESRSADGLSFQLSTRNYTVADLPVIPLDPDTCEPGDYTPPSDEPHP